ncbi:hypothetical protein NQ176_g4533 [Zarea fungicola]|uniref:Uncharacterized protein n=1 Tax=Zarea fungicola TaxID=93591 RepID=A0ACC1NDQ1_9HYPO|nr:hypothetical protein NQ176_g4533 [Lecanicillium fungicola]
MDFIKSLFPFDVATDKSPELEDENQSEPGLQKHSITDQNSTEGLDANSPGSDYSDATTYYEVHSNGPSLPILPVEIFGMVMAKLSRQDAKSLRLVCRECETKVSAHYFREIVVPFRSQMYANLIRGENGVFKNISATMLSNGGRVFDAFGPLIRRFALSLELDEESLEYPPPKPKQQIHTAFWGLYRWPHDTYTRYSDVSGLENDADEIEGMKKALKCLSHALTLGLCSDAGLGFLSGADARARHNTIRHRVFLDHNWQTSYVLPTTPAHVITISDAQLTSGITPRRAGRVVQNWKSDVVMSMLIDAGFEDSLLGEAMALLLKSECTTLGNIVLGEASAPKSEPRTEEATPSNQRELLPPFETLGIRVAQPNTASNLPPDYALVPVSLTRAQKEMLLEMEWAHRAMAQSYILCAIDCSREGYFQDLTTFNIAKIPSSHLHILCRHDFWTSFPSLKNVSLGVIPDWRHVYASAPGCVDDVAVSPLDAIPLAHHLINTYISVEPRIESFHFEWICGGELASGCHQRNQYIMPAPIAIYPDAMSRPTMTKAGKDTDMIRFPHLKHLSLKNCWIAPHYLLQSIRDYALCSLEKLELEGVSLSVMPSMGHGAPLPLSLVNLSNKVAIGNATELLSLAVPSSYWDSTLVLQQPSWLSWAGLIEHFSPTAKVRDVLNKRRSNQANCFSADRQKKLLEKLAAIIPDAEALPHEEGKYKLQCISFKSCGYVTLEHTSFNINSMIPVAELALLTGSFRLSSELMPMMQRCKDNLLGRVVPFAMLNDRLPLTEVFNMTMGWDGIYDEKIIQHALGDGCQRYGEGRFSGMVKREAVVPEPVHKRP